MARTLIGTVVSDKADKTIVVAVQTRKTHPIYKKQYLQTSKYTGHDEKNEAKAGDKVELIECRPISATKRFKLSKIVEKAGVIHSDEADTKAVKEVIGEVEKESE